MEFLLDQTELQDVVVDPQVLHDSKNCDIKNKDYTIFRAMEFGVKVIPSLLFFVLGGMRYLKIRDIGQGRVVYSLHFKTKFSISFFMGAAYFLYLIIVWAQPPTATHSSWINQCGDDFYVVFYAIYGAAWFFSCFLMAFEYVRRLSEEWYAN